MNIILLNLKIKSTSSGAVGLTMCCFSDLCISFTFTGEMGGMLRRSGGVGRIQQAGDHILGPGSFCAARSLPHTCGEWERKKKKKEGQMGLCLEDIRSANARGPD